MTETTQAPFLGDHLALDFLNTLFAVSGKTVDAITTPPRLAAWLAAARIRYPEAFAAMDPSEEKQVTPVVVTTAKELRRWLLEVLRQAGANHRLGSRARAVQTLNRVLSAGPRYRTLVPGSDGPVLRESVRSDKPVAVLLPVAEATAELLCHDNLSLVRKCGNDACVLWFYDRTKSKRRRWCSMEVCGNQAKVNAFRQRQRRRAAGRQQRGGNRG
jgi:predicted RNA-binding Zn ribbon-like protein